MQYRTTSSVRVYMTCLWLFAGQSACGGQTPAESRVPQLPASTPSDSSDSSDTRGPTAGGLDNPPAAPVNDLIGPVRPNTDTAATDGLRDGTCARADVSVDRIRPRVVFLVDSSSSMAEDFGGPTRWQALRESLLADDGVVPTLHELVKFGFVGYAGPRYTTCPAYRFAAPAPENLMFVDAAFPETPPRESSTPTGAAMDWAIDHAFHNEMPAPDKRIEPQYMIFATDGEPNGCAQGTDTEPARDFDSVIAAAHKAAARGIRIFVVSLAEASGEFADHLAEVAAIGQTDAVYSPASKTDLVKELQTIVGDAISCEVELRGQVAAGMECSGEVTLSGEPLECNGADGWELVDPTHIRFNGQACEDYRLSVDAFATASFPCAALL